MSFFDIDIIIDNDLRKSFVASSQTKVELLKKKINKNIENVEFLFKGDILENDKCLSDYNIIHESLIYCFNISKPDMIVSNSGSINTLDNFLDSASTSVFIILGVTSLIRLINNLAIRVKSLSNDNVFF